MVKVNNQKKSVFKELGSISDEAVSLGAALAMGFLLVAPGFMALMAMVKQNIDFTMNIYLPMIKHLVFPLACSVVLIIYILVIIRLQMAGATVGKIFRQNPTFVIFLLAMLAIVASQVYCGAQYALTGYCAAALGETFGMEICYFIFILFGATQVKVEAHKRALLRIHLLISMELVLAAFILWHTQETSTFFSDWTPRFSSIFSNINYYGYYLAISVPVAGAAFVYEKKLQWKVVSAIAFVINTIALSLDDTMGAWVASAIAIVFIIVAHFIIERKINWQTLILIPVFLICLYVPGKVEGSFDESFTALTSDISDLVSGKETEHIGTNRGRLWKAALDIIYDNSVFGIGFEGVKAKGYVGPPYNIRPHNEFIQYALFHGIPMAVLYIAGCLGIFIRALRKRKKMNGATLVSLAGAIGYLASSFFGLTVFSTAYFLFIFLGMGYVNESEDNPALAEKPEISRRNNIIVAALIVVATAGLLVLAAVKATHNSDTTPGNKNSGSQNEAANNTEQIAEQESDLPFTTYGGVSYSIDTDYAIVVNSVLSDYYSEVIDIPEKVPYDGNNYPVTVIDELAFEGFDELKKLSIPSSVKVIGNNAFDMCEALEEIIISDGVEYIGDEAFLSCSSLKTVVLPSSVEEIGESLFEGCSSLNSVKLSENITSVPYYTFSECESLTDIKISIKVKVIGEGAFWGCEGLAAIELPEGLKTIENDAFYNCTALKEIRIPSTVESIGDSVFDNCDSLTTVYVSNDSLEKYTEQFKEYGFKVEGY